MKAHWDRERDPLVALQQGRPGLFEEFVRSEAGTLIAFFQRLGGARGEAEDLTQEVFLKLYRQASHYQPQGTFEAFALRIARNAWIDRRRREAARIPAQPFSAEGEGRRPMLEPCSSEREPGFELAQAEERARVQRALARLSANHAIIFELAVVQSRPYQEIAAELGIPVGTVKSRVFHALAQLREALEAGLPALGDAGKTASPRARSMERPTPRLHKPLGGAP